MRFWRGKISEICGILPRRVAGASLGRAVAGRRPRQYFLCVFGAGKSQKFAAYFRAEWPGLASAGGLRGDGRDSTFYAFLARENLRSLRHTSAPSGRG